MRQSSFLLSFFLSLVIFAVFLSAMIIVINPKQTLGTSPTSPFYAYHDNFLLRKIDLMESIPADHSFDTIILGSSTSEVLIPIDVNQVFKAKSFSGSIGGGQTPIRYAFFKQAQKQFPELRRIIYMVDFFEFNHLEMSGDFLYQDKLRTLFSDILPQESWASELSKIKYHLSHQMIESSFAVLNKYLKEKKTIIHPDGTTQQSMILSPLKETKTPHRPLNQLDKSNLMKQVNENYYTYSKLVLNDFHELNPSTLTLFKQLITEARQVEVEIHFILAPYQYDFKQMLFKNKQLEKRYQEWSEFMLSLKQEGVFVYPFHEEGPGLDSHSPHWRDGIHFDRYSLFEYLKKHVVIDKSSRSH